MQDDDDCNNEFSWNVKSTRMLINFYRKYRNKVGTMQIRSLKNMWIKIAGDLQALNISVLPNHCENRWKVLERNYKKWLKNNNSTGRGRKVFEFSAEMDDIYYKTKYIHPVITLSTTPHNVPVKTENLQEVQVASDTPIAASGSSTTDNGNSIKEGSCTKNVTVLQQMRKDRLIYQNARLEFMRESHKEIVRLIEERNKILKGQKCNCNCNKDTPQC